MKTTQFDSSRRKFFGQKLEIAVQMGNNFSSIHDNINPPHGQNEMHET